MEFAIANAVTRCLYNIAQLRTCKGSINTVLLMGTLTLISNDYIMKRASIRLITKGTTVRASTILITKDTTVRASTRLITKDTTVRAFTRLIIIYMTNDINFVARLSLTTKE